MKKIDDTKKSLRLALWRISPTVTMEDVSTVSGISVQQLHAISRNPDAQVKIQTIDRIFLATQTLCGRGLAPHDYLNVSDFSKRVGI